MSSSVRSTPTPLELVPSNSTTGFFRSCGNHTGVVAQNLFNKIKKPGTHSIELSFHPQKENKETQKNEKQEKNDKIEKTEDTKTFTVVYEIKSRSVKYCRICFPSSCFASWCCCCVGSKLEHKHLVILRTPEKNIELGRGVGNSKEEACLLVCRNIIAVVNETLNQVSNPGTCSCLSFCSFSCLKNYCPCCTSSVVNQMVSARISPSPPPLNLD